MTKCIVQKPYVMKDDDMNVCNGQSATVCKKKIGILDLIIDK